MSFTNNVFLALMQLLATKQPISASELIETMKHDGYESIEVRQAIQLAFERGGIKLDEQMRVVISERQLVAA